MAGLYLHIPFCTVRCRYCDFYSTTHTEVVDRFVEALLIELERRREELPGGIDTIYFGGGTPSLLPLHHFDTLLGALHTHYSIAPTAEITIEANPGDLDHLALRELTTLGINRWSIGAQSFDASTLRFLGRRHDSRATRQMVRQLHDYGIRNISLDLIYGIPYTTLQTLDHDLRCLTQLSPTHISAYHLIYETGTPLHREVETGRLRPLAEELSLEMGHLVSDTLCAAGYEHYEISNFARPGFRSRHNSAYWQSTPYLGFGPSAHSYTHPWRSSNPSSLQDYITQLIGQGTIQQEREEITPTLAYEEYLLTRLRTSDGISLDEVREIAPTRTQELEERLRPYLSRGLIIYRNARFALSRAGIDLSDSIIASLF